MKLLISAALLTWFFKTQKIDFSELARILGEVDFFCLTLATLSWILLLALGGWRWWLLLGAMGVEARLWPCVRLTLAAVFFSTISFGPLAADGMRTWWASRYFEARLVPAVISLVADRLAGLFALGLLCLCLFPAQWDVLMSQSETALVLLLVVFLLAGSAGMVVLSVVLRPSSGSGRRGFLKSLSFEARRREISAAVGTLWERPKTFLAVLLISLVIQILSVASGVLTLLSLRIDFELLYGACMIPIINLLQSLPVTIMGLGVRESTAAVLFSHVTDSSAPALAFAMLNFVISLAGAAVGLFFWLTIRQQQTASKFVE